MKSNLITNLKELGVEKILFCSGARNNQILELVKNDFSVEFHLDERAASFEALGVAKLSNKPVAICTTSGTAVAECFAAVLEAYHSEIPLIVISGDRPARLRKTHAPQTIDQTNIYSSYVRTMYSGTLSDLEFDFEGFPIHLNFEIDDAHKAYKKGSVIEMKKEELRTYNSPVLILSEGHHLTNEELKELNSLEIPKYSECLANHFFEESKFNIDNEKELLHHFEQNKTDLIIHIGRTPVTKLWRILEKEKESFPVVNIGRKKFGLARGFYTKDKKFFIEHMQSLKGGRIQKFNPVQFLEELKKSEPAIINGILNTISKNSIVFAGNSMPIRYIELLKKEGLRYIASRGVNGIDGQIATAIGFAKATKAEVHAILGDLTFLYDVSSLFKELPRNLVIHVIDNDGGRIFERVEVNKRLINSHGRNLREIIDKLPGAINVKIHEVDNIETESFWKRWI